MCLSMHTRSDSVCWRRLISTYFYHKKHWFILCWQRASIFLFIATSSKIISSCISSGSKGWRASSLYTFTSGSEPSSLSASGICYLEVSSPPLDYWLFVPVKAEAAWPGAAGWFSRYRAAAFAWSYFSFSYCWRSCISSSCCCVMLRHLIER